MKFFSRKALVAAAAAATISFGGAGAAMAQTADEAPVEATVYANTNTDNNKNDDNKDDAKENKGSSSFDKDRADEVKAWIGVATAVISALGALFGFINKYFKIF
ncbi:hypothetical protein COM45_06600 [Corynebacterium accolens]|uniref:Secreted protein n=1 Tax=Corynebacterium accolens TaxID=38284 RepID=A0A2A4AJY1_9CORY|nr:hypothetical protein COM45_06600 [Corynebacterium accolens]